MRIKSVCFSYLVDVQGHSEGSVESIASALRYGRWSASSLPHRLLHRYSSAPVKMKPPTFLISAVNSWTFQV